MLFLDRPLVCPVCGIASHLDAVTRERIRQIEAKALRQLRAPEPAR
ncbi:MAG: sigma factor-like helix-turn-helix DNA-binding protein [Bryobacteraceae bacterium]